MTDPFSYDYGQTPLTNDEIVGLIPNWVTTREELNEVEQRNIASGERWCFSARTRRDITEKFACQLHRRMFGGVWRWAGKYRTTDKNIGCSFYRIPIEIRNLFNDAAAWRQGNVYPPAEFAVRFSHRLVSIHPFPDGNGRHSRMMGDVILYVLDGNRLSWGRARVAAGEPASEVRRVYIEALQRADNHELGPLVEFAQS